MAVERLRVLPTAGGTFMVAERDRKIRDQVMGLGADALELSDRIYYERALAEEAVKNLLKMLDDRR